MSMKISNDTIGNRTRDLPVCSAVLQRTALPRDGVGYVGDILERLCKEAALAEIEVLRETTQYLRIVHVPAEIQTGHFLSTYTSQKRAVFAA
jgi:hypothetical protein